MSMSEEKKPDELLTALESIKGLLEKSELKLNAAKASISEATPGISAATELDDLHDEEEIEVPVLSDIVVHDDKGGSSVDIEVLKAFLDEMQKKIEKDMRSTIMKAVVAAETDIKKQIRAYLNQLRKMLNEQ
jgi:hypothetical protein